MNKFFKLSKIRIVILVFIACFICLEILIRVFFYERYKDIQMPLINQPDSITGFSYIPNMKSEIRKPSISKKVKLNNIGFYDINRSISKPIDTFRIVVTGSSQLTGIWMNGQMPYSLIVDSMFKAQGHKVEIINCGIDGASRDLEHLKFIEHKVLSLKPDLIISEIPYHLPFVYTNRKRTDYRNYLIEYKGDSITSLERQKQIVDNLYNYKFITWIYDMSFSVRALCHNYSYRHRTKFAKYVFWYWVRSIYILAEDDYISYVYPTEKCKSLYKDLNEKITQQNCKWIGLWYFKEIEQNKLDLFRDLNIPILKTLWPSNNRSKIHKYDVHFNQYANYQIGKSLYSDLIKLKLIPERYLNNEEN